MELKLIPVLLMLLVLAGCGLSPSPGPSPAPANWTSDRGLYHPDCQGPVDFTWWPKRPLIGDEVEFHDRSNRDIARWFWVFEERYGWDYDSGFYLDEVAHEWWFPGRYRVWMLVVDYCGNGAEVEKEIQIRDPEYERYHSPSR